MQHTRGREEMTIFSYGSDSERERGERAEAIDRFDGLKSSEVLLLAQEMVDDGGGGDGCDVGTRGRT